MFLLLLLLYDMKGYTCLYTYSTNSSINENLLFFLFPPFQFWNIKKKSLFGEFFSSFLYCLCCWPLMLYNFMPLHTFHFFLFSFLFPHSSFYFSCFGMVGWESSCDMRNDNHVDENVFCGFLTIVIDAEIRSHLCK